MMQSLKKLAGLSFSDWRALWLALFAMPLIRMSLRSKGLKKTQALLKSKHATQTNSNEDDVLVAKSVSRMVFLAAAYGPYRANCLTKSLTAWWLLGRRGIDTELKIGVNKDTGQVNAHAWLEYQGQVFLDTADVGERFSTFER